MHLAVIGRLNPLAAGAVRCAVKKKQEVPIHDADKTSDRAIRFRVGINLGNAIADGADLHGDAVNVAARLEADRVAFISAG